MRGKARVYEARAGARRVTVETDLGSNAARQMARNMLGRQRIHGFKELDVPAERDGEAHAVGG